MFKFLFLILVAMSSLAFSQDTGEPEVSSEVHKQNSIARKIDEFGPLAECDRGARLDFLAVELQEDRNAKGYIIFYQGENVLPSAIENQNYAKKLYVDYLTQNRGIPPERIVFINSYRNETVTELWIVPENAAPPKLTYTIDKPKIPTDKTLLFDRSSIDFLFGDSTYVDVLLPSKKAEYEKNTGIYNTDFEEVSTENMPDGLNLSAEEIEDLKFDWTSDGFGAFLEKNKKMKGVIMFYADDQEFDIGKLINHIEEGKQRIAKAANIEPERMLVVFGGYKSYIQIEFYAVPEKGIVPAPEPDERIIEEETETEDQ